MNNMKVEDAVRDSIEDWLTLDKGQLNLNDPLEKYGCDSLDIVQIVMSIEEKLGLDLNDINGMSVTTAQEMIDFINRK